MSALRHAILGVGGVGGLIGACLAHVGDPVTLVVTARIARAHILNNFNWKVAFGNFHVPVARATEVPPVDVLWIAVKATQLETSLEGDHQARGREGYRSVAEWNRSRWI